MSRINTRKRWVSVLGAIVLLTVSPVRAADPAEELQATIDNVLAVLQDADFKGPNKLTARRNKLKSIIYPKFDFAEMAKRSMGPHWSRRTPEEQKQFIDLFTELVEASYVDAIESYDGDKIVIGNEKQDQKFAEVSSKIVTKKADSFSIDYKLHQVDGAWKVYDAIIENISLINNYHSQFDRVIAQSSYEELLNRMKEKKFAAPKRTSKS